MYHDGQGNVLTTVSMDAASYFSSAINDFLNYRTTPSAQLKNALSEDPEFALALCLRGYFLMMVENRKVIPKVREILRSLIPQVSMLSERERLHVKALESVSYTHLRAPRA